MSQIWAIVGSLETTQEAFSFLFFINWEAYRGSFSKEDLIGFLTILLGEYMCLLPRLVPPKLLADYRN